MTKTPAKQTSVVIDQLANAKQTSVVIDQLANAKQASVVIDRSAGKVKGGARTEMAREPGLRERRGVRHVAGVARNRPCPLVGPR